jgi:N-methylhydantoinase A
MLQAAGVPPDRRALVRSADVRYRRQAYELTIPVAEGNIDSGVLRDLGSSFHARHEHTYGHANRAEAVQLVTLRLTAVGRRAGLRLARAGNPDAAKVRERDVWFADCGFVFTAVHWRDGLTFGTELIGPVVIEALDSTVVVPPGWRATVDGMGYLRLGRQ